MPSQLHFWAIGGESHTAPENTLPAFWAALGSGANGLAISVCLTSDGVVVCCDPKNLKETCGDPRKMSELSVKELQKLDAGSTFRSAVLSDQNQPIARGTDEPWTGQGKHSNQWLYHPRLAEVLVMFSRRTKLLLFLCPNGSSEKARQAIVNAVAKLLVKFGLDHSAFLACDSNTLPLTKRALPEAPQVLVAEADIKANFAVSIAKRLKADFLLIRAEQFVSATGTPDAVFIKSLGTKLKVLVTSNTMPFALAPAQLRKILGKSWLAGILCLAIHETIDAIHPRCELFGDAFKGKVLNEMIWKIGYSKKNADTKVFQDDGLIIKIKKGGDYSGGAALTAFPIHGNFDVRVAYHVTNPSQGTTFELAAIQVGPGYKQTNLTFDVHGTPPYASSERDENDGFRIGWNNGPALTKFIPTQLIMKKKKTKYFVEGVRVEAQSSNLYNEYGRDVGNAKEDSPRGELRLVRTGSIFNAYYKDKYNKTWVLSGSSLVPSLANDVFLRLGAKHWPKNGIVPPANTITFKNFVLSQRKI